MTKDEIDDLIGCLLQPYDQSQSRRIAEEHRAADALEALQARIDEYDQLFELAQKREWPWIERWRAETGKPLSLPDYGEMLGWLCDRAERAEAENERLKAGLETIKNIVLKYLKKLYYKHGNHY